MSALLPRGLFTEIYRITWCEYGVPVPYKPYIVKDLCCPAEINLQPSLQLVYLQCVDGVNSTSHSTGSMEGFKGSWLA